MTQAPHTPNHSQQATEQRLIDLEIKASYTEDQLEQLDRVVVRQQQQIDLLMREVASLREQPKDGDVVVGRSLRDDLPPHF
jgi:SlyX protein